MPRKIKTEAGARLFYEDKGYFPEDWEHLAPKEEPEHSEKYDALQRQVGRGLLTPAGMDSTVSGQHAIAHQRFLRMEKKKEEKARGESIEQGLISQDAATLLDSGISPSAKYTKTGKEIAEKETRVKETEKRKSEYESEKKELINIIKTVGITRVNELGKTVQENINPLLIKKVFRAIEKGADYYDYKPEMLEILNEPSIKEAITNLVERYPERFGKEKQLEEVPGF